MKKSFLLLIFAVCIINVNAQIVGISDYLSKGSKPDSTQVEKKKTSSGFDYEEIVNVNLSKSVLWINLKKWVSSNFSSYKHVVDMEDKEAGVLVIKWCSDVEKPYSRYWTVQYEATYQIDVRENKYRIKIYNSTAYTEPNIKNVDGMSTSSLYEAKKELETLTKICSALQGSQTWNLDERYLVVMERNSEYKPMMGAVKEGYMSFNNGILKSLKNSMTIVDDF